MKYFLADYSKHKSRVNQQDFIGAFLEANVKHKLFVELDIRYGEYFPEYDRYFGRQLRLYKSIYGMTNYVKLFADKIINFMIYEAGFNQSTFQMSLYYKYAPGGSKLAVLYYVDDCLYLYTYE